MPLPDAQKVRLARRALKRGLSSRQLEDEVRRVKAALPKAPRGRPRLAAFQMTIRQLGRIVERQDETFAGLEEVASLSQQEALALYGTVTAMRHKCEALQAALGERAGV